LRVRVYWLMLLKLSAVTGKVQDAPATAEVMFPPLMTGASCPDKGLNAVAARMMLSRILWTALPGIFITWY
jgi:hypothetical protein